MSKIKDEFALIDSLTSLTKAGLNDSVVGPGDDCAVIKLGDRNLVVSTDSMIEGTHFRRDWSSPEDIGYKLVTSSLSDIAAMGAKPIAMVNAMQLSSAESEDFLQGIYRGIAEASEKYHVPLVGGETVSSELLGFTMTVFGECESQPILRSGAQGGDDVWVSGRLGLAAAGLKMLEQGTGDGTEALHAQRRPEAQIALGLELAHKNFVTSMIDVSDGLLQDAKHLAEASAVGIELHIESMSTCTDDWPHGLVGGEDYQLLFTAPAKFRDQIRQLNVEGVSCTRIGDVNSETAFLRLRIQDVVFEDVGEWLKGQGISANYLGYQHFS